MGSAPFYCGVGGILPIEELQGVISAKSVISVSERNYRALFDLKWLYFTEICCIGDRSSLTIVIMLVYWKIEDYSSLMREESMLTKTEIVGYLNRIGIKCRSIELVYSQWVKSQGLILFI